MKILIASDHAGFELKKNLIRLLPELDWSDLGPSSVDSVDYPDFAKKLCESLLREEENGSQVLGVLICGSGQGMAMTANKYPGIRAALCWQEEVAQLARAHNDANILCLGARLIDVQLAESILKRFIATSFEGGRHLNRVRKINCN